MNIKTSAINIIAILLVIISLAFYEINHLFKKDLFVKFNFTDQHKYTFWNTKEVAIKTSIKDNDHIIIDVYKTVPAGEYNGNCIMRGDTLILNYWVEMDEKYKDEPDLALVIPVQFQYEIRTVNYKDIKVEELPIKYIKK